MFHGSAPGWLLPLAGELEGAMKLPAAGLLPVLLLLALLAAFFALLRRGAMELCMKLHDTSSSSSSNKQHKGEDVSHMRLQRHYRLYST